MTHEETGVPSSVFLLAATCMGAGALAMPYAFLKLGAAEATILLACIGMCTVYTMTLMIRLGTRFNARSYEELGVVVFKRRGRGLISSFIGVCSVKYVCVADNMYVCVCDR
jgi:amino acid permease